MKSLLQLLHPNILLPDTALPAAEADHTVFLYIYYHLYCRLPLSCVLGENVAYFSVKTQHILILLAVCLCLHLLFKGDTFRFVVTLRVTEKYEIHLILPNASYLAMRLK